MNWTRIVREGPLWLWHTGETQMMRSKTFADLGREYSRQREQHMQRSWGGIRLMLSEIQKEGQCIRMVGNWWERERERQDYIMQDVLRIQDFNPHMMRRVFGGFKECITCFLVEKALLSSCSVSRVDTNWKLVIISAKPSDRWGNWGSESYTHLPIVHRARWPGDLNPGRCIMLQALEWLPSQLTPLAKLLGKNNSWHLRYSSS